MELVGYEVTKLYGAYRLLHLLDNRIHGLLVFFKVTALRISFIWYHLKLCREARGLGEASQGR